MTQNHDSFDEPRTPFHISLWGKIAAAFVVVLLVLSLTASNFLDQEKYRALVVEKVKQATGYDLVWSGDIGLRLLPTPGATLNDVVIKNSNNEQLLSVKKTSISLAILPLLTGKVEVAEVSLMDPVANVRKIRNGALNWQTLKSPEVNVPGVTPEEPKNQTDQASQSFMINRVAVRNGTLTYKDESKDTTHTVQKADLDIRLQSLTGPFDVDGDLLYNDKKITLDVQSGSLSSEDKSYPLQATIHLPDNFLNVVFNGVVAQQGDMSVKGDIEIGSKHLDKTIVTFAPNARVPDALRNDMNMKATLDYGPNKIALNTLALNVGDAAWLGDIAFDGLRDPANSSVVINLTPQKSEAGGKDPLLQLLRSLSIQGRGKVLAEGGASLSQMKIQFAGNDILLDGSIKTNAAKPALDLIITSNQLDLDQLRQNFPQIAQGAGTSDSKSSPSKTSQNEQGVALPFTGALVFKIKELIFDQKTYREVGGRIAAKDAGISLGNIVAELPINSRITLNGDIANTAKFSGLDVNFSFSTASIEDLLKLYNQKPLPLKQTIGAFEARGKITGDLEDMGFAVTTSALDFNVAADGFVKNVMSSPQMNAVKLSVSHPDITKAIRTFNPQYAAISGLSGSLNVSSTVSWADQVINLKAIKGNLGRADVAGDLAITQAKIPQVAGQLNFGSLNFTEGTATTGAVSASAPRGQAAAQGGARWSREAIKTEWMRAFEADLKITADSITKNLWRFQNANLNFILKNGNLTVADMGAEVFGGSAKMNGEVKGGSSDSDGMVINWNAVMNNIDARQLQSALTSKSSDTINGTITNMQTKIAANGVSPAALVQSLSGNGSITGKDLIVKGVDAAALAETARGSFKPLERAGSLFSSFQKGQTEFTTMDVAYDISGGVVNFTKLNLDGPSSKIDSTGDVNLPRWTIDLKNTMTVKNTDIPPFDFVISGPLDNPLQTGGSIIENYLRDRAQKKVQKLIGKELEKRFGIPMNGAETTPAPTPEGGVAPAEQPAAQPAQPATPQDALKNILGDPNTQKAIEGLFR